MKGTMPIVTCDSEDGCAEWIVDWYEATADDWRELMRGWAYNPHDWTRDEQFCPRHVAEAQS